MAIFSQVVDDLLRELVRPDLNSMLPGYLTQTIRESHMSAEDRSPVLFPDNRLEVKVIANPVIENAYLWQIPNPSVLQAIEAVYYPSVSRYANETSPLLINASNLNNPNDQFCYYRSGTQIAMRGFGQENDSILISWFEFPKSLVYVPATNANRLVYDVETETYTLPAESTRTLEQAKLLSTNWLLERHEEMLKEGVRAKAYARMDDQFRAQASYSKYSQMLLGMQKTESMPQRIIRHN